MLKLVADKLPKGFGELIDASCAEGIKGMRRLSPEWEAGAECFNKSGAALFAAYQNDKLVGIAGTTLERNLTAPAMRMRRLFVLPQYRRKGIAGTLAKACMGHGLRSADLLTCNATASTAAGPFWEAMEFAPVDLPNITHIYHASGRSKY